MQDFGVKRGIFQEKMRGFVVKSGIFQEKMHDFRDNGVFFGEKMLALVVKARFSKRKCMIFAIMGCFPRENA